MKLLSTLPNCREGGIAVLAQGLFAESEDVQRLATEILSRLEKTACGRQALSKLNYFLMLKYQANLQHREMQKQISPQHHFQPS